MVERMKQGKERDSVERLPGARILKKLSLFLSEIHGHGFWVIW
jgi:hypothetical protein